MEEQLSGNFELRKYSFVSESCWSSLFVSSPKGHLVLSSRREKRLLSGATGLVIPKPILPINNGRDDKLPRPKITSSIVWVNVMVYESYLGRTPSLFYLVTFPGPLLSVQSYNQGVPPVREPLFDPPRYILPSIMVYIVPHFPRQPLWPQHGFPKPEVLLARWILS